MKTGLEGSRLRTRAELRRADRQSLTVDMLVSLLVDFLAAREALHRSLERSDFWLPSLTLTSSFSFHETLVLLLLLRIKKMIQDRESRCRLND